MKREVVTAYAKHGNVKAEVTTGKAEVITAYAKHGNVKTEVTTGKAEVVTAYAKHGNVKAEVITGKAEVVTACAKLKPLLEFEIGRRTTLKFRVMKAIAPAKSIKLHQDLRKNHEKA